MATRKTVAHMDEAEKEYKRWNDRVNQQYSRARKKRRFEELQTQNKILKAELETTKVELESFRRREAAVRSALDWVSTIVNDSSTTGSKPPPKPAANSEQHEAPTRSSDTNSSTSSISQPPQVAANTVPPTCSEPIAPDHDFDTQALELSAQHNAVFGDFSSTFNGLNGNCVLNLPTEFGDGAWVNLLSTDVWTDPAATNFYNALAPLTPEQSPSRTSQAATATSAADQPQSIARNTGFPNAQMELDVLTEPWQELPLNVGATNELDRVLLEVTDLGRQWKSRQGDYHSELSHPSFPSISSLLNRDIENDRSNNPLAAALAKYTVTTPVVNFARKVAFHYTVAHLLRWLVNPTEQSFSQLPSFLHPTPIQKTVPHPAWIDTVPWPQARDQIILNLRTFDYETFKRVTQLSSINWPHADREIFIAKPGCKQMMLNPKFVRHVLNLNNWTNGPDLAKAFPFLSGWPTSPPIGPYIWPS